jgi:ATP-dependent Zn protease
LNIAEQVLLAGRAAEEVLFGSASTHAMMDMQVRSFIPFHIVVV